MSEYITPSPPRKFVIRGIAVNILMSAADTDGAFGMIETIVPSGNGPQAHIHRDEDETFYVVSGTAEFRLGDATYICEAGSVVFGPRGVPHGYRNIGDGDLRLVITYTPGGVEGTFQEWADTDDPEEVKRIFVRHGVGPVGDGA